MTYAPTVAYLKDTALAAGAASFWHGKQNTQSINYDAPFPQAHLYLMPSKLSGPNITHQVRMSFYGNDELESSWQQSAEIIEAMDVLTQRFYQQLLEDGRFDVSDTERLAEYRTSSQLGTGWFLEFTLTGRALC